MKKLLVAAMLFFASAAVWAQSTFEFDFNGTVQQWGPYSGPCTPTSPSWPGCNGPETHQWEGDLKIGLSGSQDGVYSGADITSFVFSSNYLDLWNTDYIAPIVTVVDGTITSIVARWNLSPFFGDFNGLTATLNFGGSCSCSGFGTGVLTPVPEPETYALMLAGLGGIVGFTRYRAKKA